ncbi:MAG: beta-glucosidase [Verrucomicrobia bacterium]|nr:beta-glucosidase [Verrucomicrobiota bacterium]
MFLLLLLGGCTVQIPEPVSEAVKAPDTPPVETLPASGPVPEPEPMTTGPTERLLPIYIEDEEAAMEPLAEERESIVQKLTDEELLDLVERQTFKYFWDFAHPVSGLARETSHDTDRVTIGGSGFGVMAVIAGVNRGYVTREEAVAHLTRMSIFLRDKTERYHGAWSHWMSGATGKTIPFSEKDDGGDIVETAFMIQGLLAARQYFSENVPAEANLRAIITRLWEDVEWDWYARGGDTIEWHWSPRHGWDMGMGVVGYNECLIVYLLALASPTHAVPTSCYYKGWAKANYGIQLNIEWPERLGGPLFFAHYSFLGMSPYFADSFVMESRFKSYFELNREYTLLNRRYCVSRRNVYPYYGENCWGLTACADPVKGYMAHGPSTERDNGTISPTAAISSIVYTPAESIAAIRHFYEEYGIKGLWGPYGFKDAFNMQRNWISEKYIAIDQGPIVRTS